MLKRLFLSLALFGGLVSQAFAAGTVPGFSLQRMVDNTGTPLVNCQLYTIQAGTTSTPQNAYQDSNLSILQPNPMRCDGNGWLPQFFVADGSIKLRLTDANGNQQLVADNILVVGPSGGGGGGGTVDPTTVLSTGDIKVSYGIGTLSGFVRANGRTIGSATSGATERANLDCQALFEYLWGADANLTVSGGRGISAAADWSANKTITLPDWRGRAIAGLDDMGNAAAGRLTATYFGTAATVLGASGGSQSHTLAASEIPTITSGGVNNITVGPGPDSGVIFGNGGTQGLSPTQGTNTIPSNGSYSNDFKFSGSNSISVVSGNTGGQPHETVQPTMLATIYIKL
jgi:hypothetical protein